MNQKDQTTKQELAAAKAAAAEGGEQTAGAAPGQRRFSVSQLLPIFFIVLSILWIVIGVTKFGYFNRLKGGTAAFLPVTCAAVMLVASTVTLIQSFVKVEKPPKISFLCILFFIMSFGIVAMSYIIGLMPAMLLYVFIWIKFVEKVKWLNSIIVTAACAAVGYGLFQFALRVPFPQGMIYEALFR